MKCYFCQKDYKDEFIGKEKFDEGEYHFICKDCKERARKLNEVVEVEFEIDEDDFEPI